ncbi:hypothetical protein P4H94_28425 [Paenibacillus macerans]|uniref:hypothetical protein n=1 Tax=Paenibacillus macerans TaxID=44252 RepID=UPI002DBAA443|nr:hypothetical protein [Paenibacillus macerans]MEC0140773.1 hypothetical protein [Paenibacillus macerans]
MFTYLITYDLNVPGKDYKKLWAAIESLGPHTKPLKSVYFVKSNLTTLQVVHYLSPHIDSSDGLFITPVSSKTSGGQLPQTFWNWLN